jgi:hypothetical protein
MEVDNKPYLIITSENDVIVRLPKEVRRIPISLDWAGQGADVKITEDSSRRVGLALAAARQKHGSAWHEIDLRTRNAVIYIVDQELPLSRWNP